MVNNSNEATLKQVRDLAACASISESTGNISSSLAADEHRGEGGGVDFLGGCSLRQAAQTVI